MPRILDDSDVSAFRAKLLGAAERLFARHGAAGVSMRKIAEAMGCSATTPYRYFADKDEILAAVRAAAFDRFAEALETAFARRGSAAERSSAVGRAYWDFAHREPDAYRLIFDPAQPDEARYPELVRAGNRARACMTAHVRAMVDDGWIEGDPELLGKVIWATVHGIVVLELAGKLHDGPAPDEILRQALKLLFNGARAGLPRRTDRIKHEEVAGRPS